MDDPRARADARLEETLAAADVEDPRPACRDRLKALRAADPAAFARAVEYFETLVQAVAGGAEPLGQWITYARLLAEAGGPGRTVIVDRSGRARPYAGPAAPAAAEAARADGGAGGEARNGGEAGLVLFLPEDGRRGVLPLLAPRAPSAAQTAALDLLVRGRREP